MFIEEMPGTINIYEATFKDSLDTPAKELPDRLEDLAGSSNDFGLELHPPLKPPSCLLSPLPANVMLTTWEMGAWVGGRGGWMGGRSM